MSDSSIIQALATIASAFIAAIASIVVAYIQSAKKPDTPKPSILVPEGVKISKRRKVSMSFILPYILLGGIFGYLVSGLFTASSKIDLLPTITLTLFPTNTSVTALIVIPTQTFDLSATLTVTPPPTNTNDSLIINWIQNPINGHYYKMLDFFCTWKDCEKAAINEGSHLVTINDEEEQVWLVQTFGPHETYWIGFTDEGDEGHWYWVSGEPVTYINWQPGEPSNYQGIENYGEMDTNWPHNGKWNDDKEAVLERAIIEKISP